MGPNTNSNFDIAKSLEHIDGNDAKKFEESIKDANVDKLSELAGRILEKKKVEKQTEKQLLDVKIHEAFERRLNAVMPKNMDMDREQKLEELSGRLSKFKKLGLKTGVELSSTEELIEDVNGALDKSMKFLHEKVAEPVRANILRPLAKKMEGVPVLGPLTKMLSEIRASDVVNFVRKRFWQIVASPKFLGGIVSKIPFIGESIKDASDYAQRKIARMEMAEAVDKFKNPNQNIKVAKAVTKTEMEAFNKIKGGVAEAPKPVAPGAPAEAPKTNGPTTIAKLVQDYILTQRLAGKPAFDVSMTKLLEGRGNPVDAEKQKKEALATKMAGLDEWKKLGVSTVLLNADDKDVSLMSGTLNVAQKDIDENGAPKAGTKAELLQKAATALPRASVKIGDVTTPIEVNQDTKTVTLPFVKDVKFDGLNDLLSSIRIDQVTTFRFAKATMQNDKPRVRFMIDDQKDTGTLVMNQNPKTIESLKASKPVITPDPDAEFQQYQFAESGTWVFERKVDKKKAA